MIEFFKNLNIRTKLIISAAVFLIAFVLSFLISIDGLKKIVNANNQIQNQQVFLNNFSRKMIDASSGLSIQISNFLIKSDQLDQVKAKALEFKKIIENAKSASDFSGLTDEIKDEINKLSVFSDEIKMNSQNIILRSDNESLFVDRVNDLLRSNENFNIQLSDLLVVQNKIADNNKNQIDIVRMDMVKRIVLWMSILLFIAAVIYILTIRNIRVSIQKTLKYTERLADGDLTARSGLHTRDEIGMINEALEKLKDKFKDVINSLREVSQSIEVASNEFRSGSEVISNGANHQAAASAEISTTIEQISVMLRQLSVDAKETDNIAQRAYNGIQKGAESVDKALTSIEEIALRNSAISEISYQTKILSINASVEAARAAEYGRGFAVVAEEVKRLAESSQLSASEIKKVSKKGVQITRESAVELRGLVGEFQKTSELINKIALAGEEHVFSLEQILSTIHDLNNIIQQNASSSEELTASSEELVRLAESLNNIIGFFKLEEKTVITEVQSIENATEQKEKSDVGNIFASNQSNPYFESVKEKNEERELLMFSKPEEVRTDNYTKEEIFNEEEKVTVKEEPEVEEEKKTVRRSVKKDDSSANKPVRKGIRINLSDNDDLDNQFEKMK